MAYQLGVLAIIVVGSTVLISFVIVALFRRDLEMVAGMLAALGILYWYSDLRTPECFWRRVHLLLRDGVPLAPYGFRRNATLGYWLGIPIIYIGHLITAGTLYVAWEMIGRTGEGVPLGIAIGFALLAYTSGINLVESSYRLWAKRLNGVMPGDPGSSPLKPVVWSIAILSIVVVGRYSSEFQPIPSQQNPLNTELSPASDERKPTAIARVTVTDFLAVTYPGWTGEVIHRVDTANQIQRAAATLAGTISDGDTVNLEFEHANSQQSSQLQLKLSESGDQLNGMAVVERSELSNGMLRIVAYGDSQNPIERRPVRVTILVGDDRFVLKSYIEQEQGSFLMRDEFQFERTDGNN